MSHPFGATPELTTRPAGPGIDHVAAARANFTAEIDQATAALKIIDLRMEATEEEIARLRRQFAEDRNEAGALELTLRAAKRGLAELDGVAP